MYMCMKLNGARLLLNVVHLNKYIGVNILLAIDNNTQDQMKATNYNKYNNV